MCDTSASAVDGSLAHPLADKFGREVVYVDDNAASALVEALEEGCRVDGRQQQQGSRMR